MTQCASPRTIYGALPIRTYTCPSKREPRENMSRFALDSYILGYHIYKTIWPAPIGEVLRCQPESGNIHDPYCVAVVTAQNVTVGHVPRTISAVCRSFLRRGGSIVSQVTGSRRFSADLTQGGLEIPRVLNAVASPKLCNGRG